MLQRQQDVLDIIEKIIRCIEDLLGKDIENIWFSFQENKIITLIDEIESYFLESNYVKRNLYAMAEIKSVKASAIRVIMYSKNNDYQSFQKLEFELLPLIENLRMNFYYFNYIKGNCKKEMDYYEQGHYHYYRNRYLEESKKTENYKYDLSIIVIGYNKIEYTKKCIESLKRHLPKGIIYELIYVNHGSSDETRKFFEEQKPDKQFDIEVNGGGIMSVYRIVQGKYVMQISNDVLITENAINNLYTCASSNDNVGWIVPTTPNVSNLQCIESNYETLPEMYKFAKKNNISNPNRWEEKPRLCNPIDMIRTEIWFNWVGKIIPNLWGLCFPDDKISAILRRAGLKLYLVKDAYCYHYGSVTLKDNFSNQEQAKIDYCKGRINFIKQFGLDPWGYGMAYDVGLIQKITVKNNTEGKILGINSGMGGNPLKIKDLYKENNNINTAKVTYITQYDMNLQDVKGLGEKFYKLNNWDEYQSILKEKYDYILLENGLEESNIYKIEGLKTYLSEGGVLIIRLQEQKLFNLVTELFKIKEIVQGNNCCWLFM